MSDILLLYSRQAAVKFYEEVGFKPTKFKIGRGSAAYPLYFWTRT